jgi:hypothetical protein
MWATARIMSRCDRKNSAKSWGVVRSYPPPVFLLPDPECRNCSIDPPDPLLPSRGRDSAWAHLAPALLPSPLRPLSGSAFSAIAPPAPPVLPSSRDALCSLDLVGFTLGSLFFPELLCFFEGRSPYPLIAPLSPQITGSLSPPVIGDRPCHPI